jgi:hypothetical protein
MIQLLMRRTPLMLTVKDEGDLRLKTALSVLVDKEINPCT